ncbi:hypothetical protein HOP50_18g82130 [Chloropicon primus]|uniref:Uncharacterized protein n=1 Tax=Chloropicon primus TaxID=1764295 RepID=A0A5B8MZ95_9CHLO|nr:hypothetical protein A3770_18p81890 [Chloropicon primus]UPR04868.1 hypothetical protein HOP50_18g82130 [Chloropicon primus]|eukprot:QDZ25671.1 hypothetical protein A3770_18p81890 [Chloropicon primus]
MSSREDGLVTKVEADFAAILPHCSYSWEESVRAFDDVNDAVDSDLIVVMDRFDHAEVLKEIAAYDNIYPGGHYALKVRRLAGFKTCCETHCAVRGLGGGGGREAEDPHDLDISDPFYASSIAGGTTDEELLEARALLYSEVSESCEGLIHFLAQLQETAVHRGVSLAEEVTENLRVNDLAIGQEGAFARNPSLLRSLAARRQQSKHRGYWLDMDNVERELVAWVEKNDRSLGVMPLMQDIKDSGEYMLFHSITKYHGGKGSVAKRLGWTLEKRVGRGFWHVKENIQRALDPYLDCTEDENGVECTIPTKSSLIEKGRQDLVGAIDRLGGFKTVARDLNLKMRNPGRKALYPDLQDWDAYKQKLELWMLANDERALAEGRMPKMARLFSEGALDLYFATKKYHGGCKKVAEKMGWRRRRS